MLLQAASTFSPPTYFCRHWYEGKGDFTASSHASVLKLFTRVGSVRRGPGRKSSEKEKAQEGDQVSPGSSCFSSAAGRSVSSTLPTQDKAAKEEKTAEAG